MIALDYHAPPSCPDRAAVIAAIGDRAPAGDARVAIQITEQSSGFAGTVAVDAGAPRELSATRCDDLVTALSLVAALAIVPPRQRTPLHVEATLGPMLELGVSPDAMPGGIAELRSGPFALAVIGGHDHAQLDMSGATFWWLTTRESACWRFACGHAEIGMVHASGEDVVQGRSLDRLWLAGGAHAAYAWRYLQAEAGASVPFTRDRYYFAPNVTIHETSWVTMWVWLGIRLQIR